MTVTLALLRATTKQMLSLMGARAALRFLHPLCALQE